MRHANNCTCVNCNAKGKPVNEVFLAAAKIEDLAKIEIYDWLEGHGMITSLAEQTYIRRYGFMLIKLQKESLKQHDKVTDHYNLIINGLNHDNRTQVNRLKANRKIIDELRAVIDELRLKIRILENNFTNFRLRDAAEWSKLKEDLVMALEQRRVDWQRIKDLETKQDKLLTRLKIKEEAIIEKLDAECHDRVHDLECENGAYFEQLGDYEKTIERLKGIVENLNAEIITLQNRSNS